MRAAITALLCGFFCAVACAQESAKASPNPAPEITPPMPQAQTTPAGESSSIHPEWRSSLPDAPRPKLDDHERTPCPEGEFKPCALLGGRRYLPDHSRMTQHDKTIWDGFRHPLILAGSALLIATTVYDIEGTQSCLRAGTCRETNP